MAGLYIHIPFCRQACHYCNFHFSTQLSYVDQMVEAICSELEHRADFLQGESLQSIYWGGGTPSILSPSQVTQIFTQILKFYSLDNDPEITIEVNPDDINVQNLDIWKSWFNRLSIGIQSFFDEDLVWMNRSHSALQAHQCIKEVISSGFSDINIDLIYGSPTTPLHRWKQNLEYFKAYELPHLSAYHLTVEPNTALDVLIRKAKYASPDETEGSRQMIYLMSEMARDGFWHYEISNFCKPERVARHNTAYWQGKNYLGIGPGAHSYRSPVRHWNVSHNHQYLKGILKNGIPPGEEEILDLKTQYNEYIMLGLRTMWGISDAHIEAKFSSFQDSFKKMVKPYLDSGQVVYANSSYCLTSDGKLVADRIAADLFLLE